MSTNLVPSKVKLHSEPTPGPDCGTEWNQYHACIEKRRKGKLSEACPLFGTNWACDNIVSGQSHQHN